MEYAAEATLPQPQGHDGPRGRRIDWTLRDVMWGIGWFLALFLLFPVPFVGAAVAISGDSDSAAFYAVSLLAGAGSELGLVLVAAMFTWRKYGGGWERLGVVRPDWSTLGWAVAALGGALALGYVYGVIIEVLDVEALKSQCDDQLPRDVIDNVGLMALAGIIAIGFAPVCEEIFFRGFIFTGMLRAWGLALGVLASALVFSAAHISENLHKTIVPIFIIGAVFAAAYYRSGNILTPILAHLVFNSISFAVLAGVGCDPDDAAALASVRETLRAVMAP